MIDLSHSEIHVRFLNKLRAGLSASSGVLFLA